MRLLKQALAVVGAVVLVAMMLAVTAPKATHALVAALVEVTNTPAQSIPTWRTDNDGRNVVRLYYVETMNAGTYYSDGGHGAGNQLSDASTASLYTVPSGKRLVIDTVTLFADPLPGQQVNAYFYNGYTFTAIPALDMGNFFGVEHFQNSIAVHDYVEPGGQYGIIMGRNSTTGTMFWDVQAVGHLVDCTNGGGC